MDLTSINLEMQRLSSQAQSLSAVDRTQEHENDFSSLLKNAVGGVNDEQMKSKELKAAFEKGDPDVEISEVMLQAQKASLSFQAMIQVRNKLSEAYKDVMNMPL